MASSRKSILTIVCCITQFTFAQLQTQRSDDNTTTVAPISEPTSFYSSINGPWIDAVSYHWIQYWTPVTVGTVMVTVNEITNETSSTTIYHSEYEAGSSRLLARTDTNDAGTVTAVITDAYSSTLTVTYPSDYIQPSDKMTWFAILPTLPLPIGYTFFNSVVTTFTAEDTCCQETRVISSAPPDPSILQVGTVDVRDSLGWLYTLKGGKKSMGLSKVSSIWASQTFEIPYSGCPYTTCPAPPRYSPAPAEFGIHQAYLLATSTTTISSVDPPSPSADEAESVPQQTSGTSPNEAESVPEPTPNSSPDEAESVPKQTPSPGVQPSPESSPINTAAASVSAARDSVEPTQSIADAPLATSDSAVTSAGSDRDSLSDSQLESSGNSAFDIGGYIISGLGGSAPSAGESTAEVSHTASSTLVLQTTSKGSPQLGLSIGNILLPVLICTFAIACRM